MDESSFKKLVKDHSIVVIHFSHHAIMGHEVEFPDDLNYAIAHFADEERSCCAIYPGYEMNLPGSVGVIFEPAFSNVISVCQCDSGSSAYGSMGQPPSEQTILASLCVQACEEGCKYNEWRIKGAIPIGIFVSNPLNICVKKKNLCTNVPISFEGIAGESICLADVFTAFPKLPIYSMGSNGLIQLRAGNE